MRKAKKIFISGFICLLAIVGTANLTFSQVPQQTVTPDAETEALPEPEAPKQITDVKVENNLLSVELLDADFGTVINSIAEKSGFKVEMTGDVFTRKITTKFNQVEIERGVLRLLTLIKEKNYMTHYDVKGMLSKLEIYGSGTTMATKPSTPVPVRPQVQRPAVTPQAPVIAPPRPPVPYVRPVPARPQFPKTQPAKPQTPQPALSDDDDDDDVDDDDDEDDVTATDIPYIAPQKKPVVIPPVRK